MRASDFTPAQKSALGYGTIVAIVVGVLFLRQYFSLLVVSIIIAYLFYPLYKRLKKKMSEGSAAALTLLASILSIVVPLAMVIFLAAGQLGEFSDELSSALDTLDLNNLGGQAVDQINKILDALPFVEGNVTEESLTAWLETFLTDFSEAMVNYLTDFVSSILGLVTTFIIYLYVQVSVLRNGPTLINIFRELNPIGENISDVYVSKMGAMIRGTVQGQFIIAVAQGFLSALTFALIGYPEMFFVLFIIFTTLSVIPLGAGILIIPIGILMILFGNVVGGIIVIAEHLLINTNIDNVLRPILVPKEARLDSALMLVSVFAGLQYFGFLGIVIGPTLMVVIVTTVRVYLDVYKNYRTPALAQRKKQFGSKLRNLFKNKEQT